MKYSYIPLIQFITSLQVAFTNNQGRVLQGVVRATIGVVLKISKMLDSQDNLKRTNYLSTLLLKMFNNIRAEKTLPTTVDLSGGREVSSDQLSKRGILLFVGNMLCRCYYALNSQSNCSNVFSNVRTSNANYSQYNKSEQIEYMYLLGRHHFSHGNVEDSYRFLMWAFKNCLSDTSQQRLIIKYLIPVSIVLGKFPKPELLERFGYTQQYWPLIASIKQGNLKAFTDYLENGPCHGWYLKSNVLYFLRSKAPLLILRQLLYKVWKITSAGGGDSLIILQFEAIRAALQFSSCGANQLKENLISNPQNWYHPEKDESFEATENVCIALISKGYMKGNIFSRRGLVRLRKKDPFPSLSEIHATILKSAGSQDQWSRI